MPVTIFDGVARFTADTRNLDDFIVKLEQKLPNASERAAAATALHKDAQQQLRQALKAVTVEGGMTADNLQKLAEAERNLTLSAAAAKQQNAALKDSLVPVRQETALMAEVTGDLKSRWVDWMSIGLAAAGLKSLVANTQQSVLQLELLSETTGIAIDRLAGLADIAERNGASTEQMQTALVRLSRAQVQALEGQETYKRAFERIGISIDDVKRLNPEELLYRISDAMQKSGNSTTVMATSIDLLGRGGAVLVPILRQGSEALREQVNEAAAASGVTRDAGQAAKELAAAENELSDQTRRVMIPVMQALVPVLKFVETGFIGLKLGIANWGATVGSQIIIGVDAVKGLGAVIHDVLTLNFTKAKDDAKAAIQQIKDDQAGAATQIEANWQQYAQSYAAIHAKIPQTDLSDANKQIQIADDAGKKKAAAELKAYIAAQQQRIDSAKKYDLASVDDYVAASKLRVQEGTLTEDQLTDVLKRAENDRYQIELTALKQKALLIETKDPNNVNAVRSVYESIELLQRQHHAKMLTEQAKFLQQQKSETAPEVSIYSPNSTAITAVLQMTDSVHLLEEAYKQLGITSSTSLKEQADQAQEAFNRIKNSGTATARDVTLAEKKAIEATIAWKVATGQNANEQQVALQKVNKQLVAMGVSLDHTHRSFQSGTQMIDAWGRKLAAQRPVISGAEKAVNAFSMTISEAFASAVQQWIMGQESFGNALRQALAEELAVIAAKAAMWGLYFTAWGIADLFWNPARASADFASAAEFFGVAAAAGAAAYAIKPPSSSASGAGGGSTDTSISSPAAEAAAPQPVQVANVQHFAAGGLITSPTLAIVGDHMMSASRGASEAIVPLEDPQAMGAIAHALVEGMRNAGGGIVINQQIGGVISADNMNKVLRKASKMINRGQARLLSSNSIKVTKRT